MSEHSTTELHLQIMGEESQRKTKMFYLRLYGKVISERKPAAATWATLSD